MPFAVIGWIIGKMAIFIATLAGSFLNWVLSPDFISLPYTKPGIPPNGNPIIQAGLEVTQGFVNMVLVLVLVFIAIATILRLSGYETKKLLVTFIGIALLVNFAPVICGLIVDASNIVMNFFIQDLSADAFANNMSAKLNSMGYDVEKPFEEIFSLFAQRIFMSIFLFILAFILFMFAFIFIFRYLVIWLLVILSPLAFAFYVLPVTRKWWTMWWNQFIQWSIIGITAGFFLYLGLILVLNTPTVISPPTTENGGMFDNFLSYTVSLVFLGLGFVFGIKTSAIGANAIIDASKKGGKAGGKVAAQRGWKWTKMGAAVAGMAVAPQKMKRTYQAARALGLPVHTAAGEAVKRYWRRRVSKPIVEKITKHPAGKAAWDASKGVFSAVKDVAVASGAAALGIKIKKKGFKKCPDCGKTDVAKTAKSCPKCGHDFE